jgi:gas vesicle protein GvpL/GvpF
MADTTIVKAAAPAPAPARATYLYAVVEGDRPPDLARAPAGLPGCARPRVLDAGGGLWLVAADAPLRHYDDRALERGLKDLEWVALRAMAHQRVVEHCLRLGTVLPMKLFTLFRGDARAVAHVAGQRRALRALARRVRGRHEWGVRLSLDPEAAGRTVQKGAAAAARGAARGTAYLLRKTRERTLARDLLRDARLEADRAYASLRRLAAAAQRRPPAGDGLVLDAAFLVAAPVARKFGQAVARLQRALASRGMVVALTGPWPAYSFVGQRT